MKDITKSLLIKPTDNQIEEYWEKEKTKCKESLYYFTTNYLTINGNKFTTRMNEEEFNKYFKSYMG